MIGRVVLAAAVVIGSAAGLSCSVNDYCLNCATNDAGGGNGDAPDANGALADAIDGGPCIPTGVEICDNLDNDCNGMVDDNAEQVGDPCGAATPPCSVGTYSCAAGILTCSGVEPEPETCDNVDNNCNGTVDEGDPEGGGICGTNEGECVAGVERCMGGTIVCVGAIGMPGAVPESCNGLDDDCDGMFDEGIASGPCPGGTDVGECETGTQMCMGGGFVCVGQIGPTLELCDGLDQDCDGDNTNTFDLMNDPVNCGGCGTVCNLANAAEVCMAGSCRVGQCDPGFHDLDMDGQTPGGGNGCEYACDFQGPQEACNLADDDCDGMIDEGVTPPANFCKTIGACAGATATCTATGWQCNYGPDVSTDAMGNIVPESTCDDIDNDCDGLADESHPLKGQTCNDGEAGVCTDFGTFSCNAADPSGPLLCSAVDDDMGTPPAETCNGLDDNCDGITDNGFATGNMTGQDWVTIGAFQIMKYEAARPNASATSQGTAGGYVCARPGVIPWTNITHPQAELACQAIGARLCTEAEWQTACQATVQTLPIAGPTGNNDRVFIEAEDGIASGAVGGDTWTPYTTIAGFSGTSGMAATPNNGNSTGCNASQEANAPRIDFNVDLSTTGNYYMWVRHIDPGGSNEDSFCVGVDNTGITQLGTNSATWSWQVSPAFNIATTGVHRFSIYMREDGTPVDAVVITKNNVDVPTEHLRSWAYATDPSTPQPQTCNADPYDTDAAPGDQDDILATGSLASCYADGPGTNDVFDMSGNVKEWTQERSANVNPLRGGASNNTVNGTTCQLDFTLANDQFFFPNAGFRCCR